MTALKEYQRLESTGIWRASPDEQRRDVMVSVGDASLVIYDSAGRPLGHWSLPAVIRLNVGTRPALFAPGPDAPEELEVADDEMVDAIEKVRKTIEKRRPRQGRLRFFLLGGGLAAVLALGVFWVPERVVRHAATVVPSAKRAELGERLLGMVQRVAGQPCHTTNGSHALRKLYRRLAPERTGNLVVLSGGMRQTAHLPGGLILLNRALVEDYDAPETVAGFVVAEATRSALKDPVLSLLETTGPMSAFRLLTTGDIPDATLAVYAETLLSTRPARLPHDPLLQAFAKARVSSKPYAFAVDISGETTLTLIEADPGVTDPILKDGDWVSLQGICGE